jgi:excisionase family DNA binding protein
MQNTRRLPTKEAATYLGVSKETLRIWARQRRVASFAVCNRLAFSVEELDRVIRESERPRLQNVA